MLYGPGRESDDLPGYVVLMAQGMPTAQSRNWTSAFLPGIFLGTHIETKNTKTELIQNLMRNEIGHGTQRGQVSLTQFLNRQQAVRRRDAERLESRLHAMELAFRMQSAATEVFELAGGPQHIREMYGDTSQGRNMLIARGLAARGVRYIQCYHGGGH